MTTTTRNAHIAIIDDDPYFREIASHTLQSFGHQATAFDAFRDAERSLSDGQYDVLLLDHHLDGDDGIELLPVIRSLAPQLPVIVVTASDSTQLAIRALQSGAVDFVPKPIDEARLFASLSQAIAQRELRKELEGPGEHGLCGMLGRSQCMRNIFRTIGHVASADVPVMIQGESGTGKELAARAIHALSDRASKPFIAINMAALPRELVESTLFGHERGAFSGAVSKQIGACEEAEAGTLFLDEIGEMPIELQAKLLRFLQEGSFRRVGGQTDIKCRARILSATNRDPRAAIRDGHLRDDLYYRLSVIPLDLPSLRDRGRSDIELIATRALLDAATRHGRGFRTIAPSALDALAQYSWPGNCRELVHTIERVVVLHDGPTLTAEMLPGTLRDAETGRSPAETKAAPIPNATQELGIQAMDELERKAIEHAIRTLDGDVGAAAAALGISAATIYRKLRRYGLRVEDLR